MMRISKSPQERKQEIIEAAFVVFGIFGLLHGHHDIGHQRMPTPEFLAWVQQC